MYDKHEKRGNVSINVLMPKEKKAKETIMRLVAEKNKACTKIIEGITPLLTCSAVSLLELKSVTQ